MSWKFILILAALATFVSCSDAPKDDAEKLCDCGREMIKMLNDKAPKEDIKKKDGECEKIANEFENKYKDDKDKLKEFKEALDVCGESIEADFEAAMEKYDEPVQQ